MLTAAIVFFSLAAFLGLILLTFVLKGKDTPRAVVLTHGPLAVTGLVLLLIYAFRHKPGPIEALIAFMIAALGGAILIIRDLTGKTIPKWLAVVHGMVAATGLVLLIIFVTNGNW